MDKQLVVDGTGHVAGKLASYVAKKLLTGYKVTVLGTEGICYASPLARCMEKYRSYKHKRSIYNPERGPFTLTEPSAYFKKVVRGMTPRKTKRGTRALENLTCFEGIPKEFEGTERFIFPKALLRVAADCNLKSCTLGEILGKFGWAYGDLACKLTSELRARESVSLKASNEAADKKQKLMAEQSFIAELNKRLEECA